MEKIKNYFHQKRIQRILYFYSNLQPTGYFEKKRKDVIFISRDAWLHFALTLLSLGIINGLFISIFKTSNLLVGFLLAIIAVELADWLFYKLVETFDMIFDYIIPVVLVIIFLSIFISIKYLHQGPAMKESLSNWRDQINKDLQSKPVPVQINPSAGNNWSIPLEGNGLKTMSFEDAWKHCYSMGPGWKMYDQDPDFKADPEPTFNRSFSTWMHLKSQNARAAGQFEPQNGLIRPRAFSMGGEMQAVLCIKKVGP